MAIPATIQGILWDNDGLLVDTERLYFAANRQVLQKAGIELTPDRFREVSLRQGRSLLDLARMAGRPEHEVLALRRERDGVYSAMLRSGVRVFPGVEWTLERLRRLGLRMGIVTSAQRVHFEVMHARSGLLPYFEFVLALGEYRASKPSPAPYQEGLVKLRLPPQNVLVVEDSERGLSSATAAGLRCVMVPNDQTRGGNFSRAAAVVSEVSGIARLIE